MQALFGPAIALMNKLRYRSKFLLLGLASGLVMLVLLINVFVNLSREIQTSEQELAGLQMLKPASQRDGKTHRAYLWAYSPGRHEAMKAVVYDFCESRAGKHALEFLQGWSGTLLVDDYAGYKQLMGDKVQEAGCWAHARRKFEELSRGGSSASAVASSRAALLLRPAPAGRPEKRTMRPMNFSCSALCSCSVGQPLRASTSSSAAKC